MEELTLSEILFSCSQSKFITLVRSSFHRQSDLLVKLNRLLERCLRNSKCIDTESLCVVAGEKVRNMFKIS
jgi:exosome complex RNA-binding protein Rrp42 (RNase PH superfamily)